MEELSTEAQTHERGRRQTALHKRKAACAAGSVRNRKNRNDAEDCIRNAIEYLECNQTSRVVCHRLKKCAAAARIESARRQLLTLQNVFARNERMEPSLRTREPASPARTLTQLLQSSRSGFPRSPSSGSTEPSVPAPRLRSPPPSLPTTASPAPSTGSTS